MYNQDLDLLKSMKKLVYKPFIQYSKEKCGSDITCWMDFFRNDFEKKN